MKRAAHAIAIGLTLLLLAIASCTRWQDGGRSLPSGLVMEVPGTNYAVVAIKYPAGHYAERSYVQFGLYRGSNRVLACLEVGSGRLRTWGRWLR